MTQLLIDSSKQQQQQQQKYQQQQKCRILYSTQSGRAKACARRTARIINDRNYQCRPTTGLISTDTVVALQNGHGTTFDDALLSMRTPISSTETAATTTTDSTRTSTVTNYVQYMKQSGTTLLLCFISTTGDGEHTVRMTIG
jgi:hypothetical protein